MFSALVEHLTHSWVYFKKFKPALMVTVNRTFNAASDFKGSLKTKDQETNDENLE